jgi:hypothetical protein
MSADEIASLRAVSVSQGTACYRHARYGQQYDSCSTEICAGVSGRGVRAEVAPQDMEFADRWPEGA